MGIFETVNQLRLRNISAGIEDGVLTVYLKANSDRVFNRKRDVTAAFLSGIGYDHYWNAKKVTK